MFYLRTHSHEVWFGAGQIIKYFLRELLVICARLCRFHWLSSSLGEKAGMEGLDMAFYKNRAVYHTLQDSIPGMGTGEARRALWAMMENVRGVGLSLLNDNKPDDGQDTGVYFDGRTSAFIIGIFFDYVSS